MALRQSTGDMMIKDYDNELLLLALVLPCDHALVLKQSDRISLSSDPQTTAVRRSCLTTEKIRHS